MHDADTKHKSVMEVKVMVNFSRTISPVLTILFLATNAAAFAQAPPPGNGAAPAPGMGAPSPGYGAPVARPGAPAPAPGTAGAPQSLANYKTLPLSAQAASTRLEELRNLMPNIRPKDFQDLADHYLEWIADMADGHWKLYGAFSKVEGMKPQAEQEKQITLKLGSLKRQAMLLKAEFLIRENRQPEALHPLVEIVTAEPKTATGESAYQLLKQIGFSEEAASTSLSAGATP